MSWLPKFRTAESVAREIYEGLKDGTVVLRKDEPEPVVQLAELQQLKVTLDERLDRMIQLAQSRSTIVDDKPTVSALDVRMMLLGAMDELPVYAKASESKPTERF